MRKGGVGVGKSLQNSFADLADVPDCGMFDVRYGNGCGDGHGG